MTIVFITRGRQERLRVSRRHFIMHEGNKIALWAALAAAGLACSSPKRQQPAPPPLYPQIGHGQPGSGPIPQRPAGTAPQPTAPQPTAQQPPVLQPAPTYPSAPPSHPAPYTPQPAPPRATAPGVPLEVNALRQIAGNVVGQLVQDLPPHIAQRVRGIPLVFEGKPGEINAYAACTRKGHSAFGITDSLLEVSWWLAQSAAHDETFGGDRVQRYISTVVLGSQKDKPLPRPNARFFASTQGDPRVVARAQTLLEEQLAFALGHELAHHYLGHLPCTAAASNLSAVGRIFTDTLPAFNQPAEHWADGAATHGLLTTARRRGGQGLAAWTETGAFLMLRFFESTSGSSPLLIDFQRTHPAAAARKLWVTTAAALYRNTGGAPLPLP